MDYIAASLAVLYVHNKLQQKYIFLKRKQIYWKKNFFSSFFVIFFGFINRKTVVFGGWQMLISWKKILWWLFSFTLTTVVSGIVCWFHSSLLQTCDRFAVGLKPRTKTVFARSIFLIFIPKKNTQLLIIWFFLMFFRNFYQFLNKINLCKQNIINYI